MPITRYLPRAAFAATLVLGGGTAFALFVASAWLTVPAYLHGTARPPGFWAWLVAFGHLLWRAFALPERAIAPRPTIQTLDARRFNMVAARIGHRTNPTRNMHFVASLPWSTPWQVFFALKRRRRATCEIPLGTLERARRTSGDVGGGPQPRGPRGPRGPRAKLPIDRPDKCSDTVFDSWTPILLDRRIARCATTARRSNSTGTRSPRSVMGWCG